MLLGRWESWTLTPEEVSPVCTGEFRYDRLIGTRQIGSSYAKVVIYIWHILDMHGTGTKHIVCHRQKSVLQWSVICKFTYKGINIYYFFSQLCKMLVLLIRSHCKMCPLPTVQMWAISHVILLRHLLGKSTFRGVEAESLFDSEINSDCANF